MIESVFIWFGVLCAVLCALMAFCTWRDSKLHTESELYEERLLTMLLAMSSALAFAASAVV